MKSRLFETEELEVPRLSAGEKSDVDFARRYPLRILIAEDNYTNRRLLVVVLKGLGYDAHATENGRECLEAVRAGSYDILLTDVEMPEMNGLECTAEIRKGGLRIPIIAVTASYPEFSREECLQAGMNGYMTKPINFSELRRLLKETALCKWVEERNLAMTGQQ